MAVMGDISHQLPFGGVLPIALHKGEGRGCEDVWQQEYVEGRIKGTKEIREPCTVKTKKV